MIRKSLLALIAMVAFAYSGANAQMFTPITPSDLGLASGSGPLNSTFNVGSVFGLSPADITFTVSNGFVSDVTDSWTVAENSSTTFTLGGPTSVEAFVNHGANLGSPSFQNGSQSRDGVIATVGETWTFNSTLDSDYTLGQNANDYFVDYTGADDGNISSNSTGFVWISDQPVTSYTVYSNNTVDLNNNYSVGFRVVSAIPEPSAVMIVALGGLFALRRKRS